MGALSELILEAASFRSVCCLCALMIASFAVQLPFNFMSFHPSILGVGSHAVGVLFGKFLLTLKY